MPNLKDRCRIAGRVAGELAKRKQAITDSMISPTRVDPVESLSAELIPLCSALKFLASKGRSILADRKIGTWGQPVYLWGISHRVGREPWGEVLIIGTWNYPLFLTGVQAAQAYVAGNRVTIKPAEGCEQVTQILLDAFYAAGVAEDAIVMIGSDRQSAIDAIELGVEMIVLTGSATTGRAVATAAAKHLTPTIMELSGCDAVVIDPSADLPLVARSIAFGLLFNSGATCIGPRRLMTTKPIANELLPMLIAQIAERSADQDFAIHPAAVKNLIETVEASIEQGARCLTAYDSDELTTTNRSGPIVLDNVTESMPAASADVFAPLISIMRVDSVDDAILLVNECPYALAASVFGDPSIAARIAASLRVGQVTINDLIIPTADPRVCFGGRRQSGYGVTRGVEGLLAMTTPKVISQHRGKLRLHLRPRRDNDESRLRTALGWLFRS